MPTITRPYSSAPMMPAPAIIPGTSRRGLCISSDAPLATSNPTQRKTRIPIALTTPLSEGFRSAAAGVPAGRPCWTRNAMNRTVKSATAATLTNVPMFGPHLPSRKATIAMPTVSQTKTRLTTISPVVPSGLASTSESSAAMRAAVSVPPIQTGFDSQYRTDVTAPAGRPNAIRAHSYGPPSTGKADPSSAMTIPYGIRNTTSEMTSQAIAHAVNSTRSKRRSTLRSFAFSLTARVPSTGPAAPASAMGVSPLRDAAGQHLYRDINPRSPAASPPMSGHVARESLVDG